MFEIEVSQTSNAWNFAKESRYNQMSVIEWALISAISGETG